jgi:hypothetical protein
MTYEITYRDNIFQKVKVDFKTKLVKSWKELKKVPIWDQTNKCLQTMPFKKIRTLFYHNLTRIIQSLNYSPAIVAASSDSADRGRSICICTS